MTTGSQRQKNQHTCEITERDYKLLKFLWKWKAVSTMAIARKYFNHIRPSSAYRRLQFLEASGYIVSVIVEGRRHEVWTLTQKGFKHIFPKLGELQHIGYKSENFYHDYLVTAFHLGEWLTRQPNNTQSYSEQQLRRYPMDAWPAWIPQSPTHRPDGYSAYMQGEKNVVIAFEVELSPKAQHRYESVVAYYDSDDTIQMVFWLVDSKPTLTAIKRAFEKAGMRGWDKHHFIFLENFQKHGWMTPFISGRFLGKRPADFLPILSVVQASRWHRGCDVLALLNTRRRPINPNEYKTSAIPAKAD